MRSISDFLILLLGKAIFYLAWPFWVIYFRVSNHRTRVLIMHDSEALLVKGLLSSGKWGLPGGGVKRKEGIKKSAIREVKEEVGIDLEVAQLEDIGEYLSKSFFFSYKAYFFVVNLNSKPPITKQRFEIIDANWHGIDSINHLWADKDTIEVINRYKANI